MTLGEGEEKGGGEGEEGWRRRTRPTLELLRALQRNHITHIPFETLDLHVKKEVRNF